MKTIIRVSPGNTSYIVQIENVPALKYLDHEGAIFDLSYVSTIRSPAKLEPCW